jgi:hypothetical protein
VLITNNDGMSGLSVQLFIWIVQLTWSLAVLDVKAPQKHAQDLSFSDDNVEHKVELADVQSGVGMMCVVPFLCVCFCFQRDIISAFRFALDALLRSGYRPSRSLVFSLVLGEVRHHGYYDPMLPHLIILPRDSLQASDAPKVSEYLRATYGELGLGMEFEPPAPFSQSEGLKVSRLFRKFIGETPGAIVTLHPTSSVSRHAQAKPFDAGKHPSRSTWSHVD